jgi:hypothetical protein
LPCIEPPSCKVFQYSITFLQLSGKELVNLPLSSRLCDFSKNAKPLCFKKNAYGRQRVLALAQKITSDSGPISSISSKPYT